VALHSRNLEIRKIKVKKLILVLRIFFVFIKFFFRILYKIIFANSNSRYLHISALVNYYQPFSIDELLDSIINDKIDYLDPLKIKEEDLKFF
jgi:hypothetical protein